MASTPVDMQVHVTLNRQNMYTLFTINTTFIPSSLKITFITIQQSIFTEISAPFEKLETHIQTFPKLL